VNRICNDRLINCVLFTRLQQLAKQRRPCHVITRQKRRETSSPDRPRPPASQSVSILTSAVTSLPARCARTSQIHRQRPLMPQPLYQPSGLTPGERQRRPRTSRGRRNSIKIRTPLRRRSRPKSPINHAKRRTRSAAVPTQRTRQRRKCRTGKRKSATRLRNVRPRIGPPLSRRSHFRTRASRRRKNRLNRNRKQRQREIQHQLWLEV